MITPAKQYDDRPSEKGYRDNAAGSDTFSMYALERLLRDCAEQPNWRLRAKVCAAYYDGKQLNETKKWHIREEDLEERVVNLIRPVINSVLGQEAKSRTDVKVEADDDSFVDVAAVMSAKLKEAERETCAHMAVSEAYASMVKKGLGWVHVGKCSDPLGYRYRFEAVPLEEVWWDWRGQRGPTLLNGCRWLVRSRFVDLDELMAAMPKHADVLQQLAQGWTNNLDNQGYMLGEPDNVSLQSAFDNESRFNLVVNKHDWYDAARKMIKLYEVWYRVPAYVVMIELAPMKKVQYDEKNPMHVQMVSTGQGKLTKEMTSQVRNSLYAGPFRLNDEGTKRLKFPYIPFFAFRDDEDKSPYGLIDGMIAPQDDFNDRHHRIQWMLKARQISLDSDALDPKYNTLKEISEAIMRPDLVTITNPMRTNKDGGVKVTNTLQMDPEQFRVQGQSEKYIQDTAGRYASQMGSAQVQSGIANSMLIEQGEQSMGEMNDNYLYGRRCAFEALVYEISSDYEDHPFQVPVGVGQTRRMVALNGWDPQTQTAINTVKDADIKTALAETPATPAYRQQQQKDLATIIQALGNNPTATAILAPAYIESTSYPDRAAIANQLRKAGGQPLPGDRVGQAKAEAAAEQLQTEQQQQAAALTQATLEEKQASVARYTAAARDSNARAALAEAALASGKPAAEVDNIDAMTLKLKADAANEDKLISDSIAEASAA